MWDECQLAWGERHQAVIHDLQMQTLQVRNIAGQMKRENLPLALLSQLIAAQETFDDEAALRGAIPLPDNILIGTDAPGRKRQGRQTLLLVISQWADAAQLTNENVMFRMQFCWFRHASLLFAGGSAPIS